MSKGTVLVAVSVANKLLLASGEMTATGTYLNELVVPIKTLLAAGYEIELATPTGTKPILDEASLSASHFGGDEAAYKSAGDFFASDPIMQNPRTLKAVIEAGLDTYAGFFTPGGRAPITDLSQDVDLGKILLHFHQKSLPTALLCHGPVCLLATMADMKNFRTAIEHGDDVAIKAAASKGWPYAGYKMTIFTNEEEKVIEDLIPNGTMLFHVVDALQAAGGIVSKTEEMWASYVVHDRELITGQNPSSDHAVGETLVKALEKQRQTIAAA